MTGIDAELFSHRSRRRHLLEDPLPDAALRPPIVAVIDRCMRSILRGAIAPAASGLKDVQDATDHALADKAYDADSFRNWLKRRKIKAVIPSTATRRTPYPIDQKTYRRRNVIERMFCKLKNWRRIATRYDRHAQNYLSGLALAAIVCQWI